MRWQEETSQLLNLSDQLREMNYVKHCKNKVLDVLVQMRLNMKHGKVLMA
ncbi:hypothetical protein HMPREF0602_2043 [Neisseria meningitidis ATCC 13091]|uniref:Uncharacterized protein n=1 Tax=Neisseria meningitidis serogroup B (strain ATCC 13091 / M2091) TaxID=862513 RepID=E0NC11_NEIM3|nr:hypothetical protein HMPREF0602_2043 [Neisseria meningitidis ATCC 13091]